MQELPASKLTASVAVDHAAGDVAAHHDGVLERPDSQVRLHPRVDGVSDDLVGEHVLDRAEIELALGGLDSSDRRNTE